MRIHRRAIHAVAVAALVVAIRPVHGQSTEPPTTRPLPVSRGPAVDVAGTGTTNYVPRWTDGAGTLGDSNLYSDPTFGRIGIGTTNPTGQLHIFGAGTSDVFAGMGVDLINGPAFNFGYAGASFGVGAGFFNVRPHGTAVAPNPSLRFGTDNVVRMIITNIGRVGIGTNAPAYTLDVVGTAHFTSDVTVDGNIAAKYQDIAEWVESDDKLAPGTVVVISADKVNEVGPSTSAYDTRLAGVVSAQPGLALGTAGEGKYQIATFGRVRVRVDATNGPIAAGDLLVTSDIPGTAMKSQPVKVGDVQFHKPGTLLGKALEPLESGRGEILVLLSLQ
jgi:hypothetical protein